MRPRLQTAVAFVAGLLVGATALGWYQMRSFMQVAKLRETSMLNDVPLQLQFLSSEKRTRLWRESLIEGLPRVALAANLHREDPRYSFILWNVRLAYSLYERPVPAELTEILSNLPSETAPSCPMPRRVLGLPPLTEPKSPRSSPVTDPQL
ncbi:MAG: hypothetical protein ABI689_10285 [Thermoanaerobaculia bacterium]